ncbi:MAG: hypothetical protein DMD62_11350 [Gemmatimonadetes bacterium]|nr:MAG: hypothetical protein DMD62_11350 [Gemmatimonadota bacterium]
MNPPAMLRAGAVIAAFIGLWYVVGTVAGILWTRRALVVAGVLAAVGVAGFWVPWGLDLMLLADVVLVALIWLDATLAQHVAVARDPLPAFSVGHAGEVTYRWTNPSSRRARLLIREVRPDILGGAQPARTLRIPPRSVGRETVPVVARRRGREAGGAGGFVVDSTGPLGLGRHRMQVPLPWEVVVYPPLVSVRLRASVAEALRRRDVGLKAIRRLGEGRLFESLREWVPGDDLRHIDWKATARRAKVITRQYEAERRQQVLLVLDAGRLMTAEVAGGGPGGSGVSRLDYAVQAALELAYAAAQHDDNVGIMTFADGVQHFVAPERGRAGVRGVMDVLAEVQPKLVEPDYPGAFRYLAARNRKRALTVLFTDVIDRFASDALVANVATLRPRHLPLAVTLRNSELDAAAMQRPATPRDAYRKAAAEELLHAREEALGHMRRAGVLVIDVTPERAAQAVVAKYLDLKRRGTL